MYVDQLLVKQELELLEMFTTFETANSYLVMNSMSQKVYDAKEESGLCQRQICGPKRGFVMHIMNNFGQEAFTLEREFKIPVAFCSFLACFGFACQDEVKVYTTQREHVGTVRQDCSPINPHLTVYEADDTPVYTISGPTCISIACEKFGSVEFDIQTMDNEVVGKLSKQHGGLMEFFTDADNFAVSFPMNMDVKKKAVFLAAVFLVDFVYFEKKADKPMAG